MVDPDERAPIGEEEDGRGFRRSSRRSMRTGMGARRIFCTMRHQTDGSKSC